MYRTLGQNDIATLPIASPSYSGGAMLPSLPQLYEAAPQNPGFFDIPYSEISLVTPPASPQQSQSVPTPGQSARVPQQTTPRQPAPPLSQQLDAWLNTGSNKRLVVYGFLGILAFDVLADVIKRKRRR